MKYAYILTYRSERFKRGALAWGDGYKWPCPNMFVNGHTNPRLFKSKEDAKDFLLDQDLKKGRDVSKWSPFRVGISKKWHKELFD